MKYHRICGAFVALLTLSLSLSANATLLSRLGGLAYYDTDANLTWLADANANGLMNWSAANTWADNLAVDGVSGWSLPTTADTGCSGYNCTGSEMGNLFYNVLGGTAGTGIPTTNNANYGDFSNVQSGDYWSATEYAPFPNFAWLFGMDIGNQVSANKTNNLYAWAVHAGDVGAATVPGPATVPEPPTLALLGLGLVGMGLVSRRHKARNS